MSKLNPPFSVLLLRKPNGEVTVYQRPYNPCKTVKLDEETHDILGQMAEAKETSRHAEIREAIAEHIKKFFKKAS